MGEGDDRARDRCRTEMDIDMREFIGLWNHGCWEVPQSIIYTLENQENQWYNSVWTQRSKNQDFQCPKTEDGHPSSRKESEFALPLSFCSTWALIRLDGSYPHWWGLPSLLSPSIQCQMLISSGDTLTGTPRNNISPAIWTSLRPGKLTHNINYDTGNRVFQGMKIAYHHWV